MRCERGVRSTLTLGLVGLALVAAAQAASAQTAPADSTAGVAVDDSLFGVATAAADTALGTAAGDTLASPDVLAPPEVDFWDTGRSPAAAVLMTPVMPGWGQLYNGNGWGATLAFGAELYFWSNMLSRDRQAVRVGDYANQLPPGQDRDYFAAVRAEYWEQVRDFAWWSGGVLLIIALDAYVGARLYGFDEDHVPVPNAWDEHFPADLPEPVGSRSGLYMVVWQWGKKF